MVIFNDVYVDMGLLIVACYGAYFVWWISCL